MLRAVEILQLLISCCIMPTHTLLVKKVTALIVNVQRASISVQSDMRVRIDACTSTTACPVIINAQLLLKVVSLKAVSVKRRVTWIPVVVISRNLLLRQKLSITATTIITLSKFPLIMKLYATILCQAQWNLSNPAP